MFHEKTNFLDLNIEWNQSVDPEYPFYTNYKGCKLQIKLNDFPDEQLYTLIVNGKYLIDFDDWPNNWKKIESNN